MKSFDVIGSFLLLVLGVVLGILLSAWTFVGIEDARERGLAARMLYRAHSVAHLSSEDAMYALYVLNEAYETAPNAVKAELNASRDYRLFSDERKDRFAKRLDAELAFHSEPDITEPPEMADVIK